MTSRRGDLPAADQGVADSRETHPAESPDANAAETPSDERTSEPPAPEPPPADAPATAPEAEHSNTDAPRLGGSSVSPGRTAAAEPDAADRAPSGASGTEVLRVRSTAPAARPERDPFPTAPIAADRRTPAPQAAAYHHPPNREAAEAAAPALVDDAPTEVLPVAAPASGRHRADPDDLVTEWRAPRQASRVTLGLLAALLIALGFFAGVIVGRSAGTYTPGDGARPAVTGPARPGTLR